MFDIVIIGGGSAGVSAAITARSRGKSVAVITNTVETSSLYKAEKVDNYPGIPGISGRELAENMFSQIEQSGAQVIIGRALSVMPMGSSFGIAVGNDFYEAKTVILATGITREKLYSGEAEFLGRGVSYCATCDGMLYRGKTVAVIGADKEAEEDAQFLSKIGCKVLHFTENGRYEIKGGGRADTLIYKGQEYKTDCIFIIKSTVSVIHLVSGLAYADNGITVTRGMETNIPGVFAAGDCTGKPYQLAKAAGEGNVAALSACQYIDR